jgi:outer membrane protein TolC
VLGDLLGLDDPEAVVATDSLALGPEPDLLALQRSAVDGNARVRALEVGEAVAREAMAEVRAEFSPTVTVAAGAGLSAFDRGFLPAGEPVFGPEISYGITASIPLFDGGDRRRRVENARIRLRQAELESQDARGAIAAAAAQLAAEARGFRQLAELERQNRAIARENVRVALAQFQLGFITPIDLRQVQLALLDVETRLVNAVAAAAVAEAELRLLGGRGVVSGQ